jgi:hypothetical protein
VKTKEKSQWMVGYVVLKKGIWKGSYEQVIVFTYRLEQVESFWKDMCSKRINIVYIIRMVPKGKGLLGIFLLQKEISFQTLCMISFHFLFTGSMWWCTRVVPLKSKSQLRNFQERRWSVTILCITCSSTYTFLKIKALGCTLKSFLLFLIV